MLDKTKNDEQLQIIWSQVLSVAPTDEDALDIIYQQWVIDGLNKSCGLCGGSSITRPDGSRTGKCDDCGTTIWITSGTLLTRATKFKAYLAASLFREAGLVISGAALAKLTGIQTSTAYNLERKFNLAVCSQIPADAAEISARLVQLAIAKRSRETPARMHPVSEQEMIEEMQLSKAESQLQIESEIQTTGEEVDEVDVKVTPAQNNDWTNSDHVMKTVLGKLFVDTGVTGDTISEQTGIPINLVSGTLLMLELDGKARSIPGGRYFLCEPSEAQKFLSQLDDYQAERIGMMAAKFFDMIVHYFHRIGRKALQQYFARLWCLLDRGRWGKGSFISLCATHPPISYRNMLNYVSPLMIKVVIH